MKKSVLFLFVSLICMLHNASSQIRVLSPNGGELFKEGDSCTITWQYGNLLSGQVDITYMDNNQKNSLLGVTWVTDGQLKVKIPYNLADTGRILVMHRISPYSYDYSDGDIYIQPTPFIKLNAPNVNANYFADDGITYWWTAYNVDSVKAEYTVDGTNWNLLGLFAASNNYHQLRTSQIGTKGKIRVTSLSDPAITDISDTTFSIAPRTLKLLTDLSNQVLVAGSTVNISWETNQPKPGTYFLLEYSVDGGNLWYYITVRDTGTTYTWTVPKQRSSNCFFRIQSPHADGGKLESVSGKFAIKTPIKINNPKPGDRFVHGTYVTVNWEAAANDSAWLESTIDGGFTWKLVGKYKTGTTVVMGANDVTNNGRVRLTSIFDATNRTESGVYVVEPSYMRFVNPAANENLAPGSVYTIRWTTNRRNDYRLSYSTDNGANWKAITSGWITDSSFNWTVPNEPSANCKLKVEGYWAGSPPPAISETFTIYPTQFRVTAPVTGSFWGEKQSATVRWEDFKAGATYRIEFHDGWSGVWRLLASNITSSPTGFYSRAITTPSFGCDFATQTAQVRVVRLLNGVVQAMAYSGEFSTEDGPDRDCYELSGNSVTAMDSRKLQVYPNPAQSSIEITHGNVNGNNATLTVYNVNGTIVLQKRVAIVKGAVRTRLDISALPTGTYMLKLGTASATITKQ